MHMDEKLLISKIADLVVLLYHCFIISIVTTTIATKAQILMKWDCFILKRFSAERVKLNCIHYF